MAGKVFAVCCAVITLLSLPSAAFASEGGGHGVGMTFLWMAVILVVAGVSRVVERKGQPAVLGELVAGVLLGNLALCGISAFEPMKHDVMINFLAQLGVGILLFQIGLESNIGKMRRIGMSATIVAAVGVIVPFALGTYLVGPFLLPGLSFNAYLFIGATLTATSVGITARVFQDLGKLQTREAQIILGAAVIDDILGLLILAVVSAIVTTGNVGIAKIGLITLKAFAFLGVSIAFGQLCAGRLSALFSKIHSGHGMKLITAFTFFLVFAFGAELMGLAPIVGAFAAGLVLDGVHFKGFRDPELVEDLHGDVENILSEHQSVVSSMRKKLEHARHRHVEELVASLGYIFAPVFFVYTGMQVDLSALANLPILGVALALTAAAMVGKLACGLVSGKNTNRWIVGCGMAPRGEVGLIFANIGLSLSVISTSIFSAVVTVVMLTTILTPPILAVLLKKSKTHDI